MADVNCPCGEPWELEAVYEAKREDDPEFTLDNLTILSCPACPKEKPHLLRDLIEKEILAGHLLGEDLDGVSAVIQDEMLIERKKNLP